MPVSFLSNEQRENYGRYSVALSPQDLARYFHLDDADHALIAKKRGVYNRFGFAVQLCTVRYLGTFLDDPLAVPTSVIHTLANQLGVEIVDDLRAYSVGEQRWQHAAEIRTRYGYVEITEHQVGFRLTRWLYSLCWTGTDRPSVLFERAITWLVTLTAGFIPFQVILFAHSSRVSTVTSLAPFQCSSKMPQQRSIGLYLLW